MMVSCTSVGLIPAQPMAALMAAEPSSTADLADDSPWNPHIGVRAETRMTTSVDMPGAFREGSGSALHIVFPRPFVKPSLDPTNSYRPLEVRCKAKWPSSFTSHGPAHPLRQATACILASGPFTHRSGTSIEGKAPAGHSFLGLEQ